MTEFNFTPRKLMVTGIFCFLIITLMNLFMLIDVFQSITVYDRIARIASLVFNGALVLFFAYMYKATPETEGMTQQVPQEEITEILKQVSFKTPKRRKKRLRNSIIDIDQTSKPTTSLIKNE